MSLAESAWWHRLPAFARSSVAAFGGEPQRDAAAIVSALPALRADGPPQLLRTEPWDGLRELAPLAATAPVVALRAPNAPHPIWIELALRPEGTRPAPGPRSDGELVDLVASELGGLELEVEDAWPGWSALDPPPLAPRVVTTWRSGDQLVRVIVPAPGRSAPLAPDRRPGWLAAFDVDVQIFFGPLLWLERRALAGLRAGDVLAGTGSWRVRVGSGRHGSFIATRTAEPGAIRLGAFTAPPEEPMSERQPTAANLDPEATAIHRSDDDGPTALILEDVPVPVRVVLATLHRPAAEVLEWAPGRVVSLEQSPSAPVRLEVGGRDIGRARLVEVEGCLGFQILERVGDGS